MRSLVARHWPAGFILVFIASCGEGTAKKSTGEPSAVDRANVDRIASGTTRQQQLIDPCDPRGMDGYGSASVIARSIANDSAWDLSDGTAALALLDSLERSDDQEFYSAIVLRSIARSDGAYAEALGKVLHDRSLSDPCYFLRCCWENGCDGREGLSRWTKAISQELLIEHENDLWKGYNVFRNTFEQRASEECDLQERPRIDEFLDQIGEHLKHFLTEERAQ